MTYGRPSSIPPDSYNVKLPAYDRGAVLPNDNVYKGLFVESMFVSGSFAF